MKLTALRYNGVCVQCTAAVTAKTTAWYDTVARKVTCCICRPSTVTAAARMPLPPPLPIDRGTAGISARREYAKRRAKHDRQIEDKWGTGFIGRVVKRIADEPQSTASWAKGAHGEQSLAADLDALGDIAVTLHDRKVPRTRGNIDHIVIASSGIWVIDAKNYSGTVEQRDKGGWERADLRLYVNGRDRTKLIGNMRWQVDAITRHLEPMGFSHLPIHRVICFTHADWPRFTKPFAIEGVWVIWSKALTGMIRESGSVEPTAMNAIAHELSGRLPASI